MLYGLHVALIAIQRAEMQLLKKWTVPDPWISATITPYFIAIL